MTRKCQSQLCLQLWMINSVVGNALSTMIPLGQVAEREYCCEWTYLTRSSGLLLHRVLLAREWEINHLG